MRVIQSAAAAFGLVTILAGGASAATCTMSAASAIMSATACQVGSLRDDTAAGLNGDAAFGATDYVLLAQDAGLNGIEAGDASLLTIAGNVATGNISIAQAVFDMYGTVAIVVAAPDVSRILPDGYVAYLVTGTGPYRYTSPFTQNNRKRDLVRVSLYGAAPVAVVEPPIVPLPASALLLGAAVLGLGGLRRRRTARAAS